MGSLKLCLLTLLPLLTQDNLPSAKMGNFPEIKSKRSLVAK